ncbi:MAG TPA: sigma-70 family RNA polymerase sigma factor [Blastocatellia bacterium]|nr:sigma-70 family RNA polymerase sigma factor [Blastocatellia bacterium]
MCSTHQQARDLTDNMIAYLYFGDRSEHSRIATYDGAGSLHSWVGKVTRNQAINRNYVPVTEVVPLDSLRNAPSDTAAGELEAAALFKMKYERALTRSFKTAADELTDRQRLVLALRFEDEMSVNEIAQLIGVHPAQITRNVRQAQESFRQSVLMHFATEHLLNEAGIKECLSAAVHQGAWPNFLIRLAALAHAA